CAPPSRAAALSWGARAARRGRTAGALYARRVSGAPSARRRGEIRLCRWNRERRVGEFRQRLFPLRIASTHRSDPARLALRVVRALALVERKVEQELVALDRQPFPFARAHRLLVAEFHAPEQFALVGGSRLREHRQQAYAVERMRRVGRNA